MLSSVGVVVLLGLLIVFLIKVRVLRIAGAVVCTLFGLVIGITPVGDAVQSGLTSFEDWLWQQVTQL